LSRSLGSVRYRRCGGSLILLAGGASTSTPLAAPSRPNIPLAQAPPPRSCAHFCAGQWGKFYDPFLGPAENRPLLSMRSMVHDKPVLAIRSEGRSTRRRAASRLPNVGSSQSAIFFNSVGVCADCERISELKAWPAYWLTSPAPPRWRQLTFSSLTRSSAVSRAPDVAGRRPPHLH
jgi:hypothetical protein